MASCDLFGVYFDTVVNYSESDGDITQDRLSTMSNDWASGGLPMTLEEMRTMVDSWQNNGCNLREFVNVVQLDVSDNSTTPTTTAFIDHPGSSNVVVDVEFTVDGNRLATKSVTVGSSTATVSYTTPPLSGGSHELCANIVRYQFP